MQRTTLAVAAAITVFASTGCTGDDDATPTTTEPPATIATPAPPTTEPARLGVGELADVLASRDPAKLSGLLAFTAPGSPAERYLRHQAAAREILPDGEPAAVRSIAGDVSVCDGSPTAIGGANCLSITDPEFDPGTGGLLSFAIDGRPIDARATAEGLETLDHGLGVAVRSAALSTDGELTALIETRNTSGAGVEWFGFAATYTSTDDTVVEARGAWGEMTVAANAVETILIAFASAELPGRIVLTGLRDDDVDVTIAIEVPAP